MTETLNEKWQGDAHAYHCQEFSDFYEENQRGEFGDNKDNWQDKEEYAQDLYRTHQDARETGDNPFQLVSYSAGVFCGEVYEEGDSDVFAVFPDLSNLPYAPDHLDLWAFEERLGNPDAHADGAEDALYAFGRSISEAREDGETPDREFLEPALHAFMRAAAPEYSAVLRCWNKHLSEEAFWKWHDETHSDTFFANTHCYGL